MRKLLETAGTVILLIGLAGCSAQGNAGSRPKGRSDMFETKGLPYPIRFANLQANSCLGLPLKLSGKVAWGKPYGDIETPRLPHTTLVGAGTVGVVTGTELLLFGTAGDFRKLIPIAENTPVQFGARALADITPGHLLEYRDLQGNLQLEAKDIPALEPWTRVLILLPSENDIVAAIQFTGGPHREPPRYDVYRMPIDKSARAWSYDGDGVIDRVLLTPDGASLLALHPDRAVRIALSDGATEPLPLPLSDLRSVSLGPNGEIVAIATLKDADRPVAALVACTPRGELLWQYPVASSNREQPPVVGPDGRVFLVDSGRLSCIQNGELLWKYDLSGGPHVWLTIASDNMLACLDGRHLVLFDQNGGRLFDIAVGETDETFSAPPAPGPDGSLYLAGNKKLYNIR